jgi:hypothetical protein
MPAAAPFGNKDARVRFGQIVKQVAALRIVNHGSTRNRHIEIRTITAVPVAALSMAPPPGTEDVLVAELQKSVFVRVRDEIHVPALAAIASARPPARNELFTPERNTPMPPVAGMDRDFRFVDEHVGRLRISECGLRISENIPKSDIRNPNSP